MCRSGNHVFHHEDLNPPHFSDHLKQNIMKIGALVLDFCRHDTKCIIPSGPVGIRGDVKIGWQQLQLFANSCW